MRPLLLACTVVMIAAAAASSSLLPLAHAESIILDDVRSDQSATAPSQLTYEASGLRVTSAELGDFPLLAIYVEPDSAGAAASSSGGMSLTIALPGTAFDPVFDDDNNYSIDIFTGIGLHDVFETSERNLFITELPVGIDIIDVYVVKLDAGATAAEGPAVDEGASPAAGEESVPPAVPPVVEEGKDAGSDVTASDSATAPGEESVPPAVPPVVEEGGDETTAGGEDDAVPGEMEVSPGGGGTEPAGITDAGEGRDVPAATGDDSVATGGDAGGARGGDGGDDGEKKAPTSSGPADMTAGAGHAGPAAGAEEKGEKNIAACGPGTILVDGVCVLDDSPAPVDDKPRPIGRDLMYGAAAGFLSAGVIGVILALARRAETRKRPS